MKNIYADRVNNVKPSAIRQLLSFGADSSLISFSGGYPDSSLFPMGNLKDIYSNILSGSGESALQYTYSTGMPRLRAQIAERMQKDGIHCSDENILLTNGGQQALDLVAKILIDKGDYIVTEESTYLGGLIAFNPYQPTYLSIPMDEEGLITDILEEKLKGNHKVKFLYTIPDFHNPTGITMSLERREKLIRLANEYDFIILEDTPYRDISFTDNKLPTLKSMDTEGRVIHISSFSKILVPGLRIGWAVASTELIDKLSLMKLASDTQCSTINMAAISLYLDTYNIDDHINGLKQAYTRKKDVMYSCLKEAFPSEVTYAEPQGGLFMWLRFPEKFDTGKFLMEKSVPDAKVAYVPGATFFSANTKSNFARFSFSTNTDEKIIQGVSRLGELLQKEF